MSTVAIMPEMEALASKYLRKQGIRAYSSMPKRPQWPVVIVKRFGGIGPDKRWIDAPRIQFDVYGDSKSEARLTAATARAILIGMEGQVFTKQGGDIGDAVVTSVVDDLGMSWQPDPVYTPARDRYIFGLEFVLHPVPTSE